MNESVCSECSALEGTALDRAPIQLNAEEVLPWSNASQLYFKARPLDPPLASQAKGVLYDANPVVFLVHNNITGRIVMETGLNSKYMVCDGKEKMSLRNLAK